MPEGESFGKSEFKNRRFRMGTTSSGIDRLCGASERGNGSHRFPGRRDAAPNRFLARALASLGYAQLPFQI